MNGLLKSTNSSVQVAKQPTNLINPKVGNKLVKPVKQGGPVTHDINRFAASNTTTSPAKPVPTKQAGDGLLGGISDTKVGKPVESPALDGKLSSAAMTEGEPAPTNQAQQIPPAPTTQTTSNSSANKVTTTSLSLPERPGVSLESDASDIEQPSVGSGDYENVARPDSQEYDLRDDASVANQLNGLLAEDNPYIKQAELRASQEAASRGLRNSTMGVQAGQQAAIAQALPIAQQDAQQNFQLQQNEQMHDYQMDQSMYNALLTGERDAVMQQYGLDQAQYNAALQQAQMQNQQGFELDRMDYQTQLQSVLNNEQHQQTLERMDVDQRNQLESMNQQFVNQMEAMGVEMEHQARMAFTQSSTTIMQSAMEQLGFIYSNPEMSPEQQANAVRTVMSQLQEQLNFTSSLFEPFPGLDFEPQEEQSSEPQSTGGGAGSGSSSNGGSGGSSSGGGSRGGGSGGGGSSNPSNGSAIMQR